VLTEVAKGSNQHILEKEPLIPATLSSIVGLLRL